ncbi:MAG: peptidyl-tRNA hydrolase Pth2 [Patescibacteria group bacterium]
MKPKILKQVIVVRKDLKLGKGKLATQVAHASVLASDNSDFQKEWKKEGQKKVVVWCKNLDELLSLYQESLNNNLPTALVEDAGLTQVERGTKTSLGIGPAPEGEIDKITGKLKLA